MKTTVASAPGKLVIVGEYAVVYGAPAMSVAMDRRASVRLSPRPSAGTSAGSSANSTADTADGGASACWQVTAPGFLEQALHLPHSDDPRLADQLPLLKAALDEAAYEGPGLEVVLDTQAFSVVSPAAQSEGAAAVSKLGLGSSAALCTALAAALTAASTPDSPPALSQMLATHRRFQGGRGSGIDVATSFCGGVVRFVLDPAGQRPVEATPTRLPVAGLWVWSGSSAGTTLRLDRLARYKAEQPAAFAAAIQLLSATSAAALDSAGADHADEFLVSVRDFTKQLTELDRQIDLGVWTPSHHQLNHLANRYGIHYKTSGAGGGDCGLALHQDPHTLQAFRVAAAEMGYPAWPLVDNNPGLQIDPLL